MDEPNPYESPKADTTTTQVAKVRMPFSLRAAQFSCIAWLLFYLPTRLIGPIFKPVAGIPLDLLAGLFCLTLSVGFALAIIGIVGGMQRRAAGTIAIAILGMLVDGLTLAAILDVVFLAAR